MLPFSLVLIREEGERAAEEGVVLVLHIMRNGWIFPEIIPVVSSPHASRER